VSTVRGLPHRTLRRTALLGSIRPDELMPVKVLCTRLGWARKSLRKAKAEGLSTIRYGRMDYVMGRDVIAHFQRVAAVQRKNAATDAADTDDAKP